MSHAEVDPEEVDGIPVFEDPFSLEDLPESLKSKADIPEDETETERKKALTSPVTGQEKSL